LAGSDEEVDRVGDHREVLLAGRSHDLLDVEHRGLAYERADRGKAVREDPQAVIVPGGRLAAPGHPEGDHLRSIELLAREQPEELLLLGVRRWEARLDH